MLINRYQKIFLVFYYLPNPEIRILHDKIIIRSTSATNFKDKQGLCNKQTKFDGNMLDMDQIWGNEDVNKL